MRAEKRVYVCLFKLKGVGAKWWSLCDFFVGEGYK